MKNLLITDGLSYVGSFASKLIKKIAQYCNDYNMGSMKALEKS